MSEPAAAAAAPFSEGQVAIAPFDAMLLEVRRSAYRVGWVDREIEFLLARRRVADEEPDPDTRRDLVAGLANELKWWLQESRAERRHMSRVCGDAVRVGLTQHALSALQTERETIGRVLTAAFQALELDEDQRMVAVAAMYAEVEAVMVERRGAVIQGELLG